MRKISIILAILVGIGVISSSIIPTLAVTEQSAFEQTNLNNSFISKVEAQAHLVFNDNDQGGVTKYGLWVYGRNYMINDYNGMWFHIYAQAEYKTVTINDRLGTVKTSYSWSDTPSNFILWQGDYSYGTFTPVEWTWTVGVIAGSEHFKMSLGASISGNPTTGYGSANRDDGDWRYLGYFTSHNFNIFGYAAYELTALLRLQLNNDMARNYFNGVFYDVNDYVFKYIYITKVHFKVVCDFTQRFTVLLDYVFLTHSYILGDGAPVGDLNYIPLVKGTSS